MKVGKVGVEISYFYDVLVPVDDDADVCSALDKVYATQTTEIRALGKLVNAEITFAQFEKWVTCPHATTVRDVQGTGEDAKVQILCTDCMEVIAHE